MMESMEVEPKVKMESKWHNGLGGSAGRAVSDQGDAGRTREFSRPVRTMKKER